MANDKGNEEIKINFTENLRKVQILLSCASIQLLFPSATSEEEDLKLPI
jgi:hypothetical protein